MGVFDSNCFLFLKIKGNHHTVSYRESTIFTASKRSLGKVICLQVCVCLQGGAWSRGVPALGVVCSKAVCAWSRCVPGPGGVPGLGGLLRGGCMLWVGCLLWGVPFSRGCLVETPPGWLLLQVVCILLECILVKWSFKPSCRKEEIYLPCLAQNVK